MGINGLLPTLKSITKPVHVSQYRGKTVAVDGEPGPLGWRQIAPRTPPAANRSRATDPGCSGVCGTQRSCVSPPSHRRRGSLPEL